MPYARAVETLARYEIGGLTKPPCPAGTLVECAVVATVLDEPVLTALRRLAQENESARRFGRP